MFAGHYAVGLAGRARAPRISLGIWFLAVQLLDLLWPIFLLLGWEHVRIAPGITELNPLYFYDYPVSHSLIGALAWSVAFGAGYLLLKRGRDGRRGAVLLGAGVFSHWLLDLLVHAEDLPILARGPYVGFGLWNAPAVAIPLEAALYGFGIFLYLRSTRARDAIGRWGLWSLLLVVAAIWLSGFYGPPPPDERTLAWFAMAAWLFVPWAWWVDRHRTHAAAAPPT